MTVLRESSAQGMLRLGLAFMLVATLLVAMAQPAAAFSAYYEFHFENAPSISGTASSPNVDISTHFPNETGNLHVSCSANFDSGYDDQGGWPQDGNSDYRITSYLIIKNGNDACGETFAPSTITVKKDSSDGAEAFSFSLSGTGIAPLPGSDGPLEDYPASQKGPVAGDSVSSATWVGLGQGEYYLTELMSQAQVDAGWTYDSVSCSGGTYAADLSDGVTIDLAGGQDVVCTFVNSNTPPTPRGSVKVIKSVTGDSQTLINEFGFSITDYSDFSLNAGNSWTSQTYTYDSGTQVTVAELTQLSGDWSTSVSCDDGAQSSGGSSTQVEVVGDTTITCTFVNDYDIPPPPPPPPPPPVLTVDLAVDKTGEVTVTLDDGDGTATIEWTIVVSHGATSQKDAVGATLSDSAPAGMTFVSASSADLTCGVTATDLTCGPFDLALGDSASVVVTATATEAGDYVNTAVVDVDGDTVESNNEDPADVELTEVLGVEILPETGADSDALALVAAILMLIGMALVGGSHFKSGESFTS